MKPIKGLFGDGQPAEQPEGSYPFAKNGVQYESMGTVLNEPGFTRMAVVLPYRFNGLIETDDKPVIFSTDNTSSAIGYFNPATGLYEPIVDDNPLELVNFPATGERIGLHQDYYVRGQAQRNYKGETVVAFTDKHAVPMYLNCDVPVLRALSDLRLFPYFREPRIAALQSTGGVLPAGAYFVAVGYEKKDGTSTAYSAVSDVVLLTSDPTASNASDKSLQVTITEADTDYDYMRVAIISRVKGVTGAVELVDYLPVTGGTIELDYTGDNLSTDIDVSSILVAPVVYDRVQAIGQLNDYLYIGGLHQEAAITDMQPWALTVGLEWESTLIDVTAAPAEHRNGSKKSRMHGEVYAWYIRYHKTRGGFTGWFHLPGHLPAPADLDAGTEPGTMRYQLEDTMPYWDIAARRGATGIWMNRTERYPDTEAFDASALGGPNLRNAAVLHHRMPSLQWCKEKLYPAEDRYGQTKLDLLGIRAVGVRIPDKYKGVLDGYELGYARRTTANATIYGQGLMLHPATDHNGDGPAAQLYSSGGNWTTGVLHKSDNNYNDDLELNTLRTGFFRVHPFDLLYSKPSIHPDLLHAQYKLRYDNITKGHGLLEDGDNGDDLRNADFPYCYLIDYTQGNKPVLPATNNKYRRVLSSLYLTGTINAERFVNTRHENCFAGALSGALPLSSSTAMARIRGTGTVGDIGFEEGWIVNLVALRQDVYQSFYSQPVVSAGQWQPLTGIATTWGGDTFCSDYTFHTYGRHDSADTKGDGINGKKVIRRIACETIGNLALRYEQPGNIYSKWYPVTPVATDDEQNYITLMDRSQDPNQFGYDREFNALNDFVDQVIWSPYREELSAFPFRVHRGGKASRTGRPRAWRSFLPLDYYEMPKDKGTLQNLEGMDDTLLIHMRNALFATRDKATLEGGVMSITLGTGDIFQFEPQEAESSKLGYGGTVHDLACLKSPLGYLFPDSTTGEFFLFKGKLQLLNPGLNRFLTRYLDPEGVNVLQGNGITVGWDRRYKRALLTVKHKPLPVTLKQYRDDPAFFASLQPGDLVQWGSRVLVYNGLWTDCVQPPPPPLLTWAPLEPVCLLTADGRQTGMKAWSKRHSSGGVTEDNTPNGGNGPYFPAVADALTCPPALDIITWRKSAPLCLSGTTAHCPPGYTLSGDGTLCIRDTIVPATVTRMGSKVARSANPAYSNYGARVYSPLFTNADLPLSTLAIPQSHLAGASSSDYWRNEEATSTDGPMNHDGVWISSQNRTDSNGDLLPDALAAGTQTTLAWAYNNTGAARTVHVGMGGDNLFQFKFNGEIRAEVTDRSDTDNFKYWHIVPVVLNPGLNSFNIVGTGDGSQNDSIAMVVYDNTAAELLAATADADLQILFRSSQYVNQTIDVATCEEGYTLDTSAGSGNYICRLRETAAPVGDTSGINTGVVRWQQRERLINGVLDGYSEANSAGPAYFPDEVDTVLCPVAPPKPPVETIDGVVTETHHVFRRGETQGAQMLQFTFPKPTPVALELLVGVVWRRSYDGVLLYAGNSLFTPPAGAVPELYYSMLGVDKPFVVNIPAGVTDYTVPYNIYQVGGSLKDGVATGAWVWLMPAPIVALYFRLEDPASGYAPQFTSSTPSITIHHV